MPHPAPARLALAPFTWEINFGLEPRRQQELAPELRQLLHQVFLEHPDYDRLHLPHFLGADLYLRAFRGSELAGIFLSELTHCAGEPVLHLILGLARPGAGQGQLMSTAMGLCLRLAAQAFGGEDFHAALRTANPRVVAKLWASPWARFFPRPDWSQGGARLKALRPRLCGQLFGSDRCSLEGIVFHEIYPITPWGGRVPWHHDEAVNRFCREHLGPRDAFLFLGPTRPPLAGLPGEGLVWPEGGGRSSG